MAKDAGNLLVTLGLIFLGLVLTVTPLAMWVAWTETILLGVIVVGALAGVLYCVLFRFERPEAPLRRDGAEEERAEELSDAFIEETTELHPFVHHHQRAGTPIFRAAMAHLKKHLDRKTD